MLLVSIMNKTELKLAKLKMVGPIHSKNLHYEVINLDFPFYGIKIITPFGELAMIGALNSEGWQEVKVGQWTEGYYIMW